MLMLNQLGKVKVDVRKFLSEIVKLLFLLN